MVFLDEPTSGLDSYSAVQLCQVLKKVANAGSSVLFTIHQPASEIFRSFDRLILMNKGRVMYQGSVEGVPRYFEERGQPVPPNYNPGDWIMNVAQSTEEKELDKQRFFPQDERKLADPFTAADGKDELGITLTKRKSSLGVDDTPVGIWTQTGMLFLRELKNLARDRGAVGGRFGFSIFMSTLIGVIFLNVGEQPSTSAAVRTVSTRLTLFVNG
jgi:ABC-type glutathione transport system ATPase component